MATTASSGIVTAGLKFYYDMYNTSKSYYGPPANNGITFAYNLLSGVFFNTGVTVTRNSKIIAPSVFRTPANNNTWEVNESSTVSGKHNVSYSGTSTIGTVYVLSIYAKAKERSRIYITQGSEGETVFDLATGTVVSTGGNSATTITHVGNGWYRCSAAITATTTTIGHFFGIWNGASTYAGTVGYGVYMCNPQRDVTPNYLTPFITNDIRSKTTNLYDIIGGAAVTTTDLTYNSNGTVSFNGGTQSIYIPNIIGPISNNFTIAAWIKSTDITATQNILSMNAPYFMRIVNSKVRYSVFANNEWLFQDGTTTLSSNTWYYFTMVYDYNASLWIGYINGVQEFAVTKTGTVAQTSFYGYVGYTSEVGEQSNFFGQIPVVQYYNTPLTASDVKQNFNALRGRFGV